MPRKPRFFLPEVTVHVVQRGHSRQPIFFEENDYRGYLRWLGEGAGRYQCQIHAYVLMTNHVHILITPQNNNGISRMMQYVGRHYVPYINFQYGSSGTLWEGRFKASLVHESEYLLTCMRYIELNPVRANMVAHPRDYHWSSYRANGEGKQDRLLSHNAVYMALGKSVDQRKINYRLLFHAHIDNAELKQIRQGWQTGTPLGNDYYKEEIEQKLLCKVGQARRGRPAKRALTP